MNLQRHHHPHCQIWLVSLLVAFVFLLALLPQSALGQEEAIDICPSGCRYNNIQQAINASSSGTTLRIGAGTFTESITLRPGVSLVGAGASSTILKGNGSQPVVTASDCNITRSTVIEGMGITGGGGPTGAGVQLRGASPTLRNLVIYGNNAANSGGGLAISQSADPLLDGLTVRNNSARMGSGFALTSQGRVTVRNSRLENNSATGTNTSGAIYVASTSHLTMQDSVVKGTSATNGAGIVIYDSVAEISGGRIESNSAESLGGGMMIDSSTVTIIGTTLANNSGAYGGALSISAATVTLTNCTIQGNRGQQFGGAIRLHGNSQFAVDKCSFIDNRTVQHSGGAIFSDQNSLVVRNSTFDGNRASVGAAVLLHYAPDAVLEDNTFVNNQSIDGPGVYATGGRVRLTDNTFSRNAATSFGGAVVFQDGAHGDMDGNRVEYNTAGVDGGGVVYQRQATGTMSGNVISFNRAVEVAGGVKIFDHTSPTLSHNYFEGNQADDGAAIQIEKNANPLLENNDFIGNIANKYGAVVVNIYANPTVRFNTFVRNRAGISGGAIVINDYSAPVVNKNTIAGNTAKVAAGIVVMNGSHGQITNNYISRNVADEHGGGIYLVESDTRVAGNQIVDNRAGILGGGVVILSASPLLENNLVSRNHAGDGGAGLYLGNSQATLRHNTVAGNGRNEANGDGIRLAPGAYPSLSYNMIIGNEIGIRGENGQPSQSMRNSLHDNRLANYQGVTPGGSDLVGDPQLVRGPLGAYYLSQGNRDAESVSPLVDACLETAQALGLSQLTTDIEGQLDSGPADIGYHFQVQPPKIFLPIVRLGG